MHILFLNHNVENYGTYFRCVHLARGLVRRGHKVTLLCANREDTLATTKRVEGGLTTVLLPKYRLKGFHTLHSLRMLYNTAYALALKCDVLHTFAFPLHPMAVPTLAAHYLRPGLPIVLDHDDLWKGGFANQHPGLYQRFVGWCNDTMPRMARQCTAASAMLMDSFRAAGVPDARIHYIPNCPTMGRSPLDKMQARAATGLDAMMPGDAPMVLSMGHTYTESLFQLLDAYERARQDVPELRLAFLGKMHIPADFERRLQPYVERADGRILRLGEKPPAEVPAYLAAADALLLPMDDDPIEKARFPIRFGDYLASGVPIVSNAVGEIERFLTENDCGYVAPVSDAQAFGVKVVEALTDETKRDAIRENARRLIEETLNWDAVAAKLEGIYELARKKR
ncbi:glycosyltransferase family 4 protein [Fundidesulfovibrio soli]|uniref:glycosyltransferase family 4 protein n=1 Tax=Fundidesulfovibrio soli TaxID=2922716 RepID=UPI001FAF107E|nr:glycosyltransferase family 4 protein [Fundidesulfovibrio soli]